MNDDNPLIRHCWRISLFLLVGCVVTGCRAAARPDLSRYEFSQPHMGTVFSIQMYAANAVAARQAAEAAFEEVSRLNRILSDYDPESELVRLTHAPVGQPIGVSPELCVVLAEAQRIARQSGGAFDPTIGPVIREWRRARRTGVLPSDKRLHSSLERTGWQKFQLDPGQQSVTLMVSNMQFDLGGIAKGYAADLSIAVLRAHGIERALVAASGDIVVGAPPPGAEGWRISIGTPFQQEGVDRTLLLANAAVSTSGDSEQFVVIHGRRYSHIVDPRTGLGLTNRTQVSVIGSRAMQTDALATAVSVLGPEEGRELIQSESGVGAIIFSETSSGIATVEIDR